MTFFQWRRDFEFHFDRLRGGIRPIEEISSLAQVPIRSRKRTFQLQTVAAENRIKVEAIVNIVDPIQEKNVCVNYSGLKLGLSDWFKMVT